MGGGWWGTEITCSYLFGEFLLGGSNAKNFFKNDSVGLSMCDDPIETVKYIWVNILCMLDDWIFSQKCRNKFTSGSEFSFAYSWSTSEVEVYRILDAIVPDKLLAANTNAGSYQIEEYKNSSLVVILHGLHITTTWHFHNLYVLLRENHKINVICFPSFHNGCNPACKVWRRLWMGECQNSAASAENDLLWQHNITQGRRSFIHSFVNTNISQMDP